MYKYFKELTKEYSFYLSIIPTIYSFFDTYTNIKMPEIPSGILITVGVLLFILANFEVYKNKNKEINKLQKEIDSLKINSVDYEIIKDFIKNEDLSSEFEYIKEQKEKINNINHTLNGKIYRLIKPFFSEEKWIEYEKEINEYEKKLIEYNNNEKQKYKAIFSIKNIGNKADEDINIIITPSENCSFVLENAEKPIPPIEPGIDSIYSNFRMPSLVSNYLINTNSKKVREIIKRDEKIITVDILKLKAKESEFILNDPIVSIIDGEKAILKFEIKTSNTNNPIEKEVEIIKE